MKNRTYLKPLKGQPKVYEIWESKLDSLFTILNISESISYTDLWTEWNNILSKAEEKVNILGENINFPRKIAIYG